MSEPNNQFTPESDFPAVEPPSSGFFVQLFLLPAVIVMGMAAVWYLFGVLAGNERDVQEYIQIIRNPARQDRWRAALDLAQILKEDSEHARDERLALILTEELDKALQQTGVSDDSLKEYLCGALGSFQYPTGVPILRRAVRPGETTLVRRAALISIARLADRLGDLDDPNVVPELTLVLQDPQTELREMSALALGLVKDREATAALVAALRDPQPTVRYNAANALAILGQPQAIDTLMEMLDEAELSRRFFHHDPESGDRLDITDSDLVRTTMQSSLASLRRLASQPGADLTPCVPTLETLTIHTSAPIRVAAKELLLLIKQTPAADKSAQPEEQP